ncbi:conserved hypothetical protein [Treponema primitia ZAS-2]|uniref:Cell division protein ZapB n=1 Tax=Treponema primitia (strain ATCC BAA-887 / DSM 12427 / ZAS-2) TaxID=545694 RepID=F5YNP6_TREPZ|nr:cell division protein ZapB [Treponema primitia]AEF86600.1 conserved hypothetical protein [Treponema primitia ZAS-2]
MVTLEQVRQLEEKIAKAIEYVTRVTGENKLLQGKLDGALKRVSELEGIVQRFKDDQNRIEEGIISALDRLNQFEDAIGKSLSSVQAVVSSSLPSEFSGRTPELTLEVPVNTPVKLSETLAKPPEAQSSPVVDTGPRVPDIFTLDEEDDDEPRNDSEESGAGELDIF